MAIRFAVRLFVVVVVVVVVVAMLACGASPPPPPTQDAHHGHHVASMHHSFDDADRWAREFDAPDRDAWQKPDEVVGSMAVAAGSTVVDLGAGTGYFLGRLSAAVGQSGKVIALDVEPKMVDYMKRRSERDRLANVDARVVAPSGENLPQGVDRVLVVDTWHHLGDRVAYSKKLFAALNAGGAVIVVDFTKEAPKGPPPPHRLEANAVASELATAGFKTEIARESLPHQYIVIARKP